MYYDVTVSFSIDQLALLESLAVSVYGASSNVQVRNTIYLALLELAREYNVPIVPYDR